MISLKDVKKLIGKRVTSIESDESGIISDDYVGEFFIKFDDGSIIAFSSFEINERDVTLTTYSKGESK